MDGNVRALSFSAYSARSALSAVRRRSGAVYGLTAKEIRIVEEATARA